MQRNDLGLTFEKALLIEIMNDKTRFICPDKTYCIDALEVSNDKAKRGFITLYWNADEPGLPVSRQLKKVIQLKHLIPEPSYHDPDTFHKGGGLIWRKSWENKYACHFHFLYNITPTSKDVRELVENIRQDDIGILLNPALESNILEYYK